MKSISIATNKSIPLGQKPKIKPQRVPQLIKAAQRNYNKYFKRMKLVNRSPSSTETDKHLIRTLFLRARSDLQRKIRTARLQDSLERDKRLNNILTKIARESEDLKDNIESQGKQLIDTMNNENEARKREADDIKES